VSCFSIISAKKFFFFGFYDFDLAVHDLSMWNIVHGSVYNSILGIPFLGNHMNVILFLIAPFYALMQYPLTLLFMQTIALGASAFPLYFFSRRLLDEKWALIIAVTYLFYPALAYTNLFEFHPGSLAVFFLFMCVYYYAAGSFKNFMIFVFLAMFCQENIPFAVITFGIVAALERKTLRWIIVPILMGGVYFVLALKLMSYFNQDTIQFFSLYKALGATRGEIALNIFSRPDLVIPMLARQQCMFYIVQLFLPLFFIPLFGPVILLPILPFLMQHILSIRLAELTIYYHYTAEMIPFIFAGLVYGIRFLSKRARIIRPVFLKITLLSAVVLGNLYFGPYFKIPQMLFGTGHRNYLVKIKNDLLAKIPASSGVISSFEFLPHLTHRKYLYSLHHVYMGFYTLSNKRYELPDNVEFVLIDFNDPLTFGNFYSKQGYKNLRFLNSGNWAVDDFAETIVLFRKDADSGNYICRKINGSTYTVGRKLGITVDDSIELAGYTLKRQEKGELDMVFFWRSLKSTGRDIGYLLDIYSDQGTLLARKVRPVCYRIFPTNSWKADDIFEERMRFKVPLIPGGYSFKITFFDNSSGFILKTTGGRDFAER
jgi:uncharacterized membrane protein